MGIGDWGLGIAQSPIPNPLINILVIKHNKIKLLIYFIILIILINNEYSF